MNALPLASMFPGKVIEQATGLPITEVALANLLTTERVQFVRVITCTHPRFHRGSPYKPRSVISVCVRNGVIGADYQSVVAAQRAREGISLENIPTRCRPGNLWNGAGQHVLGNRHLVRHCISGLLYLVLYPKTNALGSPVEWHRSFFGAEDLQPLPTSEVNRWRVRSKGCSWAGTKKQIQWRLPCLGSIVSITVGGMPYALVGERTKPMSAETKRTRREPLSKETEAKLQRSLEEAAAPKTVRAGRAFVPHLAYEWYSDLCSAMGHQGPGNLTRKLNEIERRGQEVFQILPHGSSFLICSRKPLPDLRTR